MTTNIRINKPYPKDYKGVEEIGEFTQDPVEEIYTIKQGGFGQGWGPGFNRHGEKQFNSNAFVITINFIYSDLYSSLYKREGDRP